MLPVLLPWISSEPPAKHNCLSFFPLKPVINKSGSTENIPVRIDEFPFCVWSSVACTFYWIIISKNRGYFYTRLNKNHVEIYHLVQILLHILNNFRTYKFLGERATCLLPSKANCFSVTLQNLYIPPSININSCIIVWNAKI